MRAPGKIVVDEFYVHLSSLDEVRNEKVSISGFQKVMLD